MEGNMSGERGEGTVVAAWQFENCAAFGGFNVALEVLQPDIVNANLEIYS